jgi:hypothetical protein
MSVTTLAIWPRSLVNVDLFKGVAHISYKERDHTADALMHDSVLLA